MRRNQNSYTLLEETHNCPAALENSLAALQIKCRVTIWHGNSTPRKKYPRKMKAYAQHNNIYMNVICLQGQGPMTACPVLPSFWIMPDPSRRVIRGSTPTHKTLVPLLQLSQPVHATHLEFYLVFIWESCWNWYPGPNSSVPGWVPDNLPNLGQFMDQLMNASK